MDLQFVVRSDCVVTFIDSVCRVLGALLGIRARHGLDDGAHAQAGPTGRHALLAVGRLSGVSAA